MQNGLMTAADKHKLDTLSTIGGGGDGGTFDVTFTGDVEGYTIDGDSGTKIANLTVIDLASIKDDLDDAKQRLDTSEDDILNMSARLDDADQRLDVSEEDILALSNRIENISVGAVSGVKGDAESEYRAGNVNLTAANIGAATSDHNHDSAYSAINHNHDTAYATINHNHDTTYAAKTHSHTEYAASNHNHDTAYAAKSHGNHVPTTGTANNAIFLRNDNNWATVTPANIGAAASSHGNHVPATQSANNAVFLRNDNTWQTVTPANIGAAASSHGNHVPATQSANNAVFLRNDNTWQTVTPANIGAAASTHTHNYAGSSSAGGAATTALKTTITVTGSNTADLMYARVADNDYVRIRAGGTASNAGYVEIATADDGNEPIYLRQYKGEFTTLTRTATLLDGSGNTTFPGTVTATGFNSSDYDVKFNGGFGTIFYGPFKPLLLGTSSGRSNYQNIIVDNNPLNTTMFKFQSRLFFWYWLEFNNTCEHVKLNVGDGVYRPILYDYNGSRTPDSVTGTSMRYPPKGALAAGYYLFFCSESATTECPNGFYCVSVAPYRFWLACIKQDLGL